MTVALINERQKTHGDWRVTARLTRALKTALESQDVDRVINLSVEHREALEMILAKIARIVSGDQDHADHWRDIAGYALLAIGEGER